MDPLSIATATLTLISGISVSARFVKRIRGAPKEILSLGDEILDLENVVYEVAEALKKENQGEHKIQSRQEHQNERPSNKQGRDSTRLLLRAQNVLHQLAEILDKKLLVSANQGALGKTSRTKWLRYRSKIDELRGELSGIKLSLATTVGAATLSDVREILLRLDGLVIVEQNSARARTQLRSITNSNPSDKNSEQDENLFYADDAGENDIGTLGSNDIADSESVRSLEGHETPTTQFGNSLPAISIRAQGRSRPSLSVIPLLNRHNVSNRCPPFCSCICHKPVSLSSPSMLSQLLGNLSVSSSGALVPFLQPRLCTEKLCRPRQESKRSITYRFPQWLTSKAITMALTSSSLSGGPQLQLRTIQVRPASADIFRLTSMGDLSGVQSLFASGKASIYDVDDRGWTALHKAFILGHSSIVSFLLDVGADVSTEADNGSSVFDRAWYFDRTDVGFPGHLSSTSARVLKGLDLEEFAASWQYTILHKTVLGLVPKTDLRTQLQMSTSLIDTPDTHGRTPLWWASACGDANALKLLLEFGAEAYKSGLDQHGPLHVAKSPEIVHLLIAAGVDVDTKDSSGRTALHCSCYRGPTHGGSLPLLRALLDSGADVNAQTVHRNTPLHFAAMYGCIEHMEELLRRGANIELLRLDKEFYVNSRYPRYSKHTISDSGAYGIYDGTTPLSTAIYFAQATSVRVLLRHGADVTKRTRSGLTILHMAATNGNMSTIEALAQAKLQGLDPNARDVAGNTPEDYLKQRIDYTESLGIAFEELVASLRRGQGPDNIDDVDRGSTGDVTDGSESDCENFEDAYQDFEA